jgi:hypothetical protein
MATATAVAQADQQLSLQTQQNIYAQNAQISDILDANGSTATYYNDPLLQGSMLVGNLTPNRNYRTTLAQKGTNLSVTGNSPQDFDLQLQNDYVDLFTAFSGNMGPVGLGGVASNIALGAINAATVFGYGMATLATVQVWKGTHPLDFTLPLSIRAYSDPRTDVIDPLRALIQMASPSPAAAGAFLKSPGPTIADMVKAVGGQFMGGGASGFTIGGALANLNNAITMFFGTGVVVPGLIITGLHVKLSNRAERKTGLPIAAEATVSLRTCIAYSRDEVLAMFYGAGFGSSNPVVSANSGGAAASTAGR